jgi:hypothetical protein
MNENLSILQEEAMNENTSPERFKQLANFSDINIRKAVTQNPNTPIDVLWKLGEDFPSELLENPILDLLFLENHNFWLEIPVQTLRSLVSVPEISSNILAQISKHNDLEVLAKIVIHPHTSTETLNNLIRHNILLIKMVAKAALDVNWGQQKSDILLENKDFIFQYLFTKISPSIRREITKSYNTPQFVLEILANDENEGVRLGVVVHNNTPFYILEKLADDSSKWVHLGLIENPKTPSMIIDKLVQTSDEEVREKIALCSKISLSTLKVLAKSSHIEVRKNIIKRLNYSLYYAELLIDLYYSEFQQSKPLLEILAEDPEKEIRLALVKHPKTPLSILKLLTRDPEFTVRFRVHIRLLIINIGNYIHSKYKFFR